jgi:ubiquitin carboxyl-terminal hydrolase L3
MSHLASSLLGPLASSRLTFHDIYTIDDPLYLAAILRPVSALIFLCPGSVFDRAREAENAAMDAYTGSGKEEPVIWFKQTIRHACGLMALLHALANSQNHEKYIRPGSLLDDLLTEAIPLELTARAAVLYNSAALEDAHAAAARLGDTLTPNDLDAEFYHFITFVKADDGHLWELNGGMKGPVDRGLLGEDEDALSEKALDLGVRSILRHAQGEAGFSIVAMSTGDV